MTSLTLTHAHVCGCACITLLKSRIQRKEKQLSYQARAGRSAGCHPVTGHSEPAGSISPWKCMPREGGGAVPMMVTPMRARHVPRALTKSPTHVISCKQHNLYSCIIISNLQMRNPKPSSEPEEFKDGH